MVNRPGEWSLLGYDSDPVKGDVDALSVLVRRYTNLADDIASEAVVLKSVGDGTSLKGLSANALRESSNQVADNLNKVRGRYEAVHQALSSYGPALQAAKDESLKALQEALDAQASKVSADALPIPDAPAAGAPPLTAEQQTQVAARNQAAGRADEAMAAARRRLQNSLSSLHDAAALATRTIRAAFDDGLTDSGWDRFASGFLNFIKIVVTVFKWVGLALAVISIVIPGLGTVGLLAAVSTVTVLFGSVILAATGEGNWTDVIFASVGVLLLGAGVVIGKSVQAAQTTALKLGAAGARRVKPPASVVPNFSRPFSGANPARTFNPPNFSRPIATSPARVFREISAAYRIKPNFWQVRRVDYWSYDFNKIKGNFALQGWSFTKLLSIDRVLRFDQLTKELSQSLGVAVAGPPASWLYISGGRSVFGFSYNVFNYGTGPLPGVAGDHHGWTAWQAAKDKTKLHH